MKHTTRSLLAALIVTLVLCSCDTIKETSRREVHVQVSNRSGADIQAQVYFGKHFVFPGRSWFIGKGFSKTVLLYPYASRKDAYVEWSVGTENFRKEVDLKDIFPRSGNGTLIFDILNEDVSARFDRK